MVAVAFLLLSLGLALTFVRLMTAHSGTLEWLVWAGGLMAGIGLVMAAATLGGHGDG